MPDLLLLSDFPFESPNWPAHWIWAHGPGSRFEAALFTRSFTLNNDTDSLRIHVSADNRYRLFLNGQVVGDGPTPGDLEHWHFDSYNLGPISSGSHTLTAVAWHDRDHAPGAQHSARPGFMLAAEAPFDTMLSTGDAWQCKVLSDHHSLRPNEHVLLAGPSYQTNGLTADDLQPSDSDVSEHWSTPEIWESVTDRRAEIAVQPWRLQLRRIPAMHREVVPLGKLRKVTSHPESITLPETWQSNPGQSAITIPAKARVVCMLDMQELVVGTPKLVASQGKGAKIEIRYQEGLLTNPDDLLGKAHRDADGVMPNFCLVDEYLADSRDDVVFEPYIPRTWRYLELTIETAGEPITLHNAIATTQNYPVDLEARYDTDEWFTQIVEPGLRTTRLCAQETFVDGPYYEYMQYTTDTWLQMLVSFVTHRDDRLEREAIRCFHHAQRPEGWIPSRYPSRIPQLIPTIGLVYITMLRDFLLWRGDKPFIENHSDAIRRLIDAFNRHRHSNGLLDRLPSWSFVDWVLHPAWRNGVPPKSDDGQSYVNSLLFLNGLIEAAELFRLLGDDVQAARWEDQAALLRAELRRCAWSPERQLFIDDPSGENISVHTNTLAALTGCADGLLDPIELIERMLADEKAAQPSLYFHTFIFEVFRRAGQAQRFWPMMRTWHDLLSNGLTTFPETPDPARSDCHAWASHPLYHYFATLIGIRPTAPGCSEMQLCPPLRESIDPELPDKIAGTFSTPLGPCQVELKSQGKQWDATLHIPQGMSVNVAGPAVASHEIYTLTKG